MLIFIFVTEGFKKNAEVTGKGAWMTNCLLQFQCSPCLSYSRASVLKIGVVIVYVCARVCMCVCTGAKKKKSALCTICAGAESECKWLSNLRTERHHGRLYCLYNHSL